MVLSLLSTTLDKNADTITRWFDQRWAGLAPLPYFSCDIRHSRHKMAVVDTNLFPGGFNNLCKTYTGVAVDQFKSFFDTGFPGIRRIALFSESHTRNKFYLENILMIQELVIRAGYECRITMPNLAIDAESISIDFDSDSGKKHLEIYKPVNTSANGNQLFLGKDWQADVVLSNNDFSSGIPECLAQLTPPIIPDPNLGWHNRYKSEHFRILDKLIDEFATLVGIDPWLIKPETRVVDGVTESALTELAGTVDAVINNTRAAYEKYGITDPPYVFIKNDSGTYGLGITFVFNSHELSALNRKQRTKLFSAKGEAQTQRFIVQEGILTADTYSDHPIEPVIYGVGKEPVGGFFRVHAAKNNYENLNSPGMSFTCLCLHKLDEPHESYFIDCAQKKELVKMAMYLARLAALAAAMELAEIKEAS